MIVTLFKRTILLISAASIFIAYPVAAETEFKTDTKKDVIRELDKKAGFIKTRGYIVYGGKYYFPDMEYPISDRGTDL